MPTRFPCRKRALQRRCLMQTMKFNVGLKVSQAASNFKDLQTVLVLMSTYRVNIQTSTIFGDTSIMYIPPLDTWAPEIVWIFYFKHYVYHSLLIPYLWISSLFRLLDYYTSQRMCIGVKQINPRANMSMWYVIYSFVYNISHRLYRSLF